MHDGDGGVGRARGERTGANHDAESVTTNELAEIEGNFQGSLKIKILGPMRGVRRTKLFRAQTTPPPRPNSTFQSYKFTIFKPSSEFTAGVFNIYFSGSEFQ